VPGVSWQYRVLHGKTGFGGLEDEWWGITEFYSFADGGRSWIDPIIIGDSREELMSVWAMMAESFDMPDVEADVSLNTVELGLGI